MTQARPERAILHVGAPKAGSTFLQGILWDNRSDLLESGIHLPGAGIGDHARASQDLRGRERAPGDPRPDASGSWDLLAALARGSRSPTVVVSDEHLAGAVPAQVARAVSTLAPRQADVVVVTRHPAAALASAWQERIKLGARTPFDRWADRRLRHTPAADRLWAEHDPADVAERWASVVPAAQIHVVLLPAADADRDELWRRFCRAAAIPPEAAPLRPRFANQSLGTAEAEYQRRVNERLPEDFGAWNHQLVSRNLLGNQILAGRSGAGRPALPDRLAALSAARAHATFDRIETGGYDVVGDQEDLLRAPGPGATGADDTQVLAVALDALPQLVAQLAQPAELATLADQAVAGRDLDGCLDVSAQAVLRLAQDKATTGLTSSASFVRARSRLAAVADRSRATARLADRFRARRQR
ncbi:MAG: hypothetical protein OEW41_09780 [Actinomycetota bacterium]|nr:hypothetical protein [Actinomycetota bacterium]